MEIWPNFFIVGAEKAGTSSLYEYFKKIPEIYMSPFKEAGYFSHHDPFDNSNQESIQDKKKYLNLFVPDKDEKIRSSGIPDEKPRNNIIITLGCNIARRLSPQECVRLDLI